MMLNIIICDDNLKMVNHLKKIIENAILIDNLLDVQIELATTNPIEVLELFRTVERHADGVEKVTPKPLKQRLLFLDIDFGADFERFDGVRLGREIRKYDIGTNIVFVTNSSDNKSDVIDEKITPLGYLKKRLSDQELRERIIDLLEESRRRMHMSTLNKKMVAFKTGASKKYFNLSDIYYVKGVDTKDKESEVKKKNLGLTLLRTTNGNQYLKKTLKFYEESVEELVRAGKSYLVNPMKVKETTNSGRRRILKLLNGEEISIGEKAFNDYEQTLKEMKQKDLL